LIVTLADFEGSKVLVAVIVVLPNPTAFTRPLEFTVATPVLLDDHVMVLAAPPTAVTVTASCVVLPTLNDRVAAPSIDNPRTAGAGGATVTETVTAAERRESATLVTVTTAEPAPTAVNNPVALTLTTDALLDTHVTPLAAPPTTVTFT
jgi:hypothetical protein